MKSMNCIVFDGVVVIDGWLCMVAMRIYRMLGHIRAMHACARTCMWLCVCVGGGGG